MTGALFSEGNFAETYYMPIVVAAPTLEIRKFISVSEIDFVSISVSEQDFAEI